MKQNFYLLGDIHGDAYPIEYWYNKNKERLNLEDSETENYLILLGDVALNYYLNLKKDSRLKQKLSMMKLKYIILRGNHEARVSRAIAKFPYNWHKEQKFDGTVYVENQFPNIYYLVDGPAIYTFGKYKTLSVPGAYSVDKWYRMFNHLVWYADEQLFESEMVYGKELAMQSPFDLVITHTCPKQYEPTDLFLDTIDQSEVDKTMELYLDEIDQSIVYKKWVFGHYHANRLYEDHKRLMLYNDKFVDMNKLMSMKPEDTLEDIIA